MIVPCRHRLAGKQWWFQLLFWGLVATSLLLLLLVNQLDPGSIPPGTAVGESILRHRSDDGRLETIQASADN